jgi:hypothetical protein
MSGRKISSCSPTSSFISCRLRLVFFRVMVCFLGCSLVTPTSYHDPFFAEPFGHYPNLSDASCSDPGTGASSLFGDRPRNNLARVAPTPATGRDLRGASLEFVSLFGDRPRFRLSHRGASLEFVSLFGDRPRFRLSQRGKPRIRLAFGDRLRFRSLQLWLRSLRDHGRIGSSFNSVGGLVLVLVLLHVLESADVSPLEQWNKITTR